MSGTDKVVALRADRATEPRGVNQECIDLLEKVLERAKTGDIQGVIMAAITDNRVIEPMWIDNMRCVEAAAAAGLLFHHFIGAWDRSPD